MTIHPDLIVSVSGIRGVVGTSLTPDVALRFAMAYGSPFRGQTILLSRDGRPSGDSLGHAIAAGLTAVGCNVIDIGIAPTPSVGVAVTWLKAAGAVQITASHNPAIWNGLKMFGPDGAVLPAAEGAAVKERFLKGDYQSAAWDGVGRTHSFDSNDVWTEHIRRIQPLVDGDQIRRAGFSVLVDANGGSGGPLALRLLSELGVKTVSIGCESTGHFAHEAEPIPAHLTTIAPEVTKTKSAIGFVLDPDADRLALIDEHGQCISEEVTLALAVKSVLKTRKGAVVVNMSTSRMNEDLARAAGCEFIRSAVGEANVVDAIRSHHAAIGGEGNGGVIEPRVGWVRDPFVGMAYILALMAEENQPISQIIASLPSYAMLKTKCQVSRESLSASLARLRDHWPRANINTVDGLRIDGPDWWLHVRPSNTEPVVRAIAEAPTTKQAQELCEIATRILSQATS
ncbi:MAG: phosphoglucosamine mutase [Gemmataceae bacterium]